MDPAGLDVGLHRIRGKAGRHPVLLTFAGTPATRAPGGTSNPSGTRHAAATIAPAPTVTRFSVTEPEPIRQPSCTTQPSRCALCPTTQSAPISVGHSCVQCTTVPSCTDVRAPTSIRPWSPRSTAHGHTDASGPILTWPMTTASGWTKAVSWISGSYSPSAYIGTLGAYRDAGGEPQLRRSSTPKRCWSQMCMDAFSG